LALAKAGAVALVLFETGWNGAAEAPVFVGNVELLGITPLEAQEEPAYGLVLPATDVVELGIGRRVVVVVVDWFVLTPSSVETYPTLADEFIIGRHCDAVDWLAAKPAPTAIYGRPAGEEWFIGRRGGADDWMLVAPTSVAMSFPANVLEFVGIGRLPGAVVDLLAVAPSSVETYSRLADIVLFVCGGGRRVRVVPTGAVPFETILMGGDWRLSDAVIFVAEIDAGKGFRTGLSVTATGVVPFETMLMGGDLRLSDAVIFVAEIDAGKGFRTGLSVMVTRAVPFETMLVVGDWRLSDAVPFVAEIDAGSGFRAGCVDWSLVTVLGRVSFQVTLVGRVWFQATLEGRVWFQVALVGRVWFHGTFAVEFDSGMGLRGGSVLLLGTVLFEATSGSIMTTTSTVKLLLSLDGTLAPFDGLVGVAVDVLFPVFGIDGLELLPGDVALADLAEELLPDCFDSPLALAGIAIVESGAELSVGFELALPSLGGGLLIPSFTGGFPVLLEFVPDESEGIVVALDENVVLTVGAWFGSVVVLDKSVGNIVEMGDELVVGLAAGSSGAKMTGDGLMDCPDEAAVAAGRSVPASVNSSDDAMSVGASVLFWSFGASVLVPSSVGASVLFCSNDAESLGASVPVLLSMASSVSVRPWPNVVASAPADSDERFPCGANVLLATTGDGLIDEPSTDSGTAVVLGTSVLSFGPSTDATEGALLGTDTLAMTGDGLMLCSPTAAVAGPSELAPMDDSDEAISLGAIVLDGLNVWFDTALGAGGLLFWSVDTAPWTTIFPDSVPPLMLEEAGEAVGG
jgi:hypothetical protein